MPINVAGAVKFLRDIPNLRGLGPDDAVRAATQHLDNGASSLSHFINKAKLSVTDPESLIKANYDATHSLDIAPTLGTDSFAKSISFISPGTRISANEFHPTVKADMEPLIEHQFLHVKNFMGLPTTQNAERFIDGRIQSSSYRFGEMASSKFTEYRSRMDGIAEKSNHPLLKSYAYRGKDFLRKVTGGEQSNLTWKGFNDEWNNALRENKPLDQIEIPEVREVVAETRKWNAERRAEQEYHKIMTPINEYDDSTVLGYVADEGRKIPDDPLERKKLVNQWKEEEEIRRENHWPVVYDQVAVRDKRGTVFERIYNKKWEEADVRFRNPETRSVRKKEITAEKQKIRISRYEEALKTKEKELRAIIADEEKLKSRLSPYKTRLKKEQVKLKRIQKQIDTLRKSISEESADDFRIRYEDGKKKLTFAVDRVIDRIINSPSGYLDFPKKMVAEKSSTIDIGPKKRGKGTRSRFTKRRQLSDLHEVLRDVMVNDPQTLIRMYEQSTVPGIELKKIGFDFDKVLYRINDDTRKALEHFPEREGEISREAESLKRDVEYMVNRVLQHKRYGDPRLFGTKVSNVMMKVNNIFLMQNVTLASFSDVGRPIMEFGLKDFGVILRAMSKDMEPFLREMKHYAKDVGVGGDIYNAARLQELTSVYEGPSNTWLDKGLNWLNDVNAIASLMNVWNDGAKRFASLLAANDMLKKGLRLARGEKLDVNELAQIRALGIADEDLIKVAQHWEETTREVHDGFMLANTERWTDKALKAQFENAVLGYTNRIITTPSAATKPLLSEDAWGRMFFQYKSFSLAATQGVLLSGLQRPDAMRLNGMLAMVWFGWLSYMARSVALGRDISADPSDHLLEGIDRSGVLAIFMDANQLVERMSNGHMGLSPMFGGEGLSRFKASDISGLLLGPSIGTANTAVKAIGGLADQAFGVTPSEGQINAQFRMVPFSNHFMFNWATRRVKDGYADFFGVQRGEQ